MRKKLGLMLFLVSFLFLGVVKVDAHSLEGLVTGDKVCVDTSVFTDYYIYTWNSASGEYNAPWPGEKMTQDGNSGVYCHEVTSYEYDFLIFNNGSGTQTIDLSALGGGLVYTFDNSSLITDGSDYGKYYGEWRVYDNSDLVELVEKVQGYKENEYTIATYQNLLNVLNGDDTTIGAIELAKKDYKDANMIVQSNNDGTYYSEYENVYNKLLEAEKALVKRAKIVVKDSVGGTIQVAYKDGSDTDVVITTSPDVGYRLQSLKVTEITGYDSDSNPILGDNVKEYVVADTTSVYEYVVSSNDIYVEAVYTKKTYKLSFTVGENGIIYDEEDKEIVSPVTVYYNDNYTLKIAANEGYTLNKVMVNGNEVNVENNLLTIENIVEDTVVEITFSIIDYVVSVEGFEYKVSYGTTYEELLELINPVKDGYIFKGIKNQNGNLLDESYIVDSDDELTLVFEKIEDESIDNPSTGNESMSLVVVLVFVVVLGLSVTLFKLRNKSFLR